MKSNCPPKKKVNICITAPSIQVLTYFFLEDSSIFFCIRILIIIIGRESGDKKLGSAKQQIRKKGVHGVKSLEASGLKVDYDQRISPLWQS